MRRWFHRNRSHPAEYSERQWIKLIGSGLRPPPAARTLLAYPSDMLSFSNGRGLAGSEATQ